MPRRVRPVPPTCPLRLLAGLVRPGEILGIWAAEPGRARRRALLRRGRLMLSADLGSLLGRVERIVAWDGVGPRVLPVGAARAPVDRRAETPVG